MKRDGIGPPDPQGYYVVIVPSDKRRRIEKILEKHQENILVEKTSNEIIIRTKSRRIARLIYKLIQNQISRL